MNRVLLIVILAVYSLYGFKLEQEFNIKTIAVEAKDISVYKEYYGKVKADESKVYDVTMRFDGFITDLYVTDSFSYVKKGDKLFDIYSESIYNLYDELSIAKKRSDSLYRSIKKKFELFDIDPKDRVKDDSTRIKSKFEGYITKHNLNNGSFVKKGAKLFEITDLSSIWVVLNIYQKDISFVKKGMRVDVKVDGLKKVYEGKVDYIYPNINEKDQTLSVRVELANNNLELYPNMFTKAKIYQVSEKMLILPKNAIIQREGKQYVFFKDGKEYAPSEVKAVRIPEGYRIVEGLDEGDEVASNALFLLDSDAVTNGLYSDDW